MPAVGADDQFGANLERAVGRVRVRADHVPGLDDEIAHLGAHQHPKFRKRGAALGQEVQKIPLRHDRDELAARRQMAQVGDGHLDTVDAAADLAQLGVRPRQEVVEHAELGHYLQGRRVDRVAAKVAQEVGVFLEHDHVDTGPREQVAEHHPGGPATGDAAARAQRLQGGPQRSSARMVGST